MARLKKNVIVGITLSMMIAAGSLWIYAGRDAHQDMAHHAASDLFDGPLDALEGLTDQDFIRRKEALQYLAYSDNCIGAGKASQLVLTDPHPAVVRRAAQYLAGCEDDSLADFVLGPFLLGDLQRENIAFSLMGKESSKAMGALLVLACDPDPRVQETAAWSLRSAPARRSKRLPPSR